MFPGEFENWYRQKVAGRLTVYIYSLRLDSLRQVRQQLLICNKDGCDPKSSPNGSLNLTFPALHDVGHVDLEGRFSR